MKGAFPTEGVLSGTVSLVGRRCAWLSVCLLRGAVLRWGGEGEALAKDRCALPFGCGAGEPVVRRGPLLSFAVASAF
jgi:hypothetical protein